MAKQGQQDERSARGATLAERADRHALYQLSVQSPGHDIEFFEHAYRELHDATPRSLREDFCGTGYLSSEWVRSRRDRTAHGVDLDRVTLAWGEEHNLAPLASSARQRVSLHRGDVRVVETPPVDVLCAMNFSHCCLKRRSDLRSYFERVRERLSPGGIFISELYGGTEAIVAIEERREVEDFVMLWEQESYNPITHETLCHIHFEFDDGSRLERAFTYDWRLWTLAEVRDLLDEVGFSGSRIYWERVDDEGEGTGVYEETEEEENQETWLVYVVASR